MLFFFLIPTVYVLISLLYKYLKVISLANVWDDTRSFFFFFKSVFFFLFIYLFILFFGGSFKLCYTAYGYPRIQILG